MFIITYLIIRLTIIRNYLHCLVTKDFKKYFMYLGTKTNYRSLALAMSFLGENKFLFGAVGIAVSSAAVGYFVGHYLKPKCAGSTGTKPTKLVVPAGVQYLMKNGLREPVPLRKLREVRIFVPLICLILFV